MALYGGVSAWLIADAYVWLIADALNGGGDALKAGGARGGAAFDATPAAAAGGAAFDVTPPGGGGTVWLIAAAGGGASVVWLIADEELEHCLLPTLSFVFGIFPAPMAFSADPHCTPEPTCICIVWSDSTAPPIETRLAYCGHQSP